MEKKMKDMMQQLRDENKELTTKLRAATDKNSDLQAEVDELKRKLKTAQVSPLSALVALPIPSCQPSPSFALVPVACCAQRLSE